MNNRRKKIALQFILLMGIVSLFGDITYEGARSIAGPYLAALGASAAMVGLVAGLGEFLGYALRIASGYVSDRAKAYWPLTIIGYGLLCAIPLMAFAGHWHLAAFFLILERMGKGIRAPARDAILSHATKQVGRGLGFGIHEAVDQIGAIIGPLFYAVAMGVDAFVALVIGRIYDKVGLSVLAVIPFFTLPVPFLALTNSYTLALLGVILWGSVMAIHETIMRAAVADLTGIEKRGTAYGLFNTIYGGAWFLGSAAMGFLYDFSVTLLVLLIIIMEVSSIIAFLILRKEVLANLPARSSGDKDHPC